MLHVQGVAQSLRIACTRILLGRLQRKGVLLMHEHAVEVAQYWFRLRVVVLENVALKYKFWRSVRGKRAEINPFGNGFLDNVVLQVHRRR